MTNSALINEFLLKPLSGPDIEACSFAIIDQELPGRGGFAPETWEVVR
jgi:hypothetical protein